MKRSSHISIKKIHFVGIGGTGMCGIAEILHNLGYKITGSDIEENDAVKKLRGLGIRINIGHRPENSLGAELVVKSTAIPFTNVEIVEAGRHNIPVMPRAQMLAELMRLKDSIVVSGTHGKTTTTSMIAQILYLAGFDPTIVIGGRLNIINGHAKLGQGKYLVAEGDESDGSFLYLMPVIAIVTSIDNDHLDFYKSMSNLKKAFIKFTNSVPFYSFAMVNIDDKNIKKVSKDFHKRHFTYALRSPADFTARDIELNFKGSSYNFFYGEECVCQVKIKVIGEYNIYNSLCAAATSFLLGVKTEIIKKALKQFTGAGRRMEYMGRLNGAIVYNDYAHHPTEILNLLQTVKELSGRRVIVILQPHRYSRTKECFEDFAPSLRDADILLLTDIYPAGEKPIPGVNSRALFKNIIKVRRGQKETFYFDSGEKITSYLKKYATKNDLILFVGAGNIYRLGLELTHKQKK